MTRGLASLLAPAALALLIVGLAWRLPLSFEEEPVSYEADLGPKGAITLQPGEFYRRTLAVSDQPIAGVRIFSPQAQRIDGKVEVQVRAGDSVLAHSSRVRQVYRGETTHLTFPFSAFSVPAETEIEVTLTRVSGTALSLIVAEESQALALSLLHPTLLPEKVRFGVITGAALMVAISLAAHASRRGWLAVTIVAALAPTLVLIGFLLPQGELGISDWDYYFTVHTRYRESLLAWQIFPFWNPYTCGGTAGLADPEFPIFSPLYPLELLLGVSRGLRSAVVMSVAIGALGMMLLARRLRLSPEAALLAALVTSFSTTTLLKLVEGHVDMLAAMWIPWIFWSWHHAYGVSASASWRSTTHNAQQLFSTWPLVCGVFLALTFLQGGIHVLLYLVPALMILSFLVRQRLRGLYVTWQAGCWALGLSAVKLLPAVLWTRQFPDQAFALSTTTLPYLYEIFLGRHSHGDVVIPEQGGGWHEYGAYVGPFVVALALLALTRWRTSRLVRALTVSVVLVILVSSLGPILGPLLELVPWMPRSYTSRIILLAVVGLALLAGIGLDVLGWLRPQGNLRLLRVLLVGLVALDLVSLSYPLAFEAFIVPGVTDPLPAAPAPLAFTRETHTVRIGGVEYDRAFAAGEAGYGTLSYCSVLSPRIAVAAVDEEHTEYVQLESGHGTVELITWRPNRVEVTADVDSSDTVLLNMNYAPGWRVNRESARNVAGRVGTTVDAGSHTLTFHYAAPGFLAGAGVTGLTLLLAGWRISRRTQGHRAG